jgi:ribonuclease-3
MLIDRTPVLPAEWETLRPKLGAEVPEELLKLALTHPSAVGEGIERTLYSNQRLEFLGDTILGAIAAEHLFRQNAEWPEGALTQRKAALVQKATLARVARRLELGKYLILGRGEFHAGGANRDGILSDALEAILAAVFLSGGLEAARAFFVRWFAEELAAGGQPTPPKNLLQELTQANALGTPVYETAPFKADAKPHERRYTSRVLLQETLWGEGVGPSKKEAESQAAQAAIARVQAHLAEAAALQAVQPAPDPAEPTNPAAVGEGEAPVDAPEDAAAEVAVIPAGDARDSGRASEGVEGAST